MGDLWDKVKYLIRHDKIDDIIQILDINKEHFNFTSLNNYLIKNISFERIRNIFKTLYEKYHDCYTTEDCIFVIYRIIEQKLPYHDLILYILSKRTEDSNSIKNMLLKKIINNVEYYKDLYDQVEDSIDYDTFYEMCNVNNYDKIKSIVDKYQEKVCNFIKDKELINGEYTNAIFKKLISLNYDKMIYISENLYNNNLGESFSYEYINSSLCAYSDNNQDNTTFSMIASWIFSKCEKLRNNEDLIKELFTHALQHENYDLGYIIFSQHQFNLTELFITYCRASNSLEYINRLQWMMTLPNNNIDIHHNNEEAFRYLCDYAPIEVVKWLYDFGGIDIRAEDDYGFKIACENSKIELAIWLTELVPEYGIEMMDNMYIPKIADNNFMLISDDGAYIPTEGIDECPICLHEKNFVIKLNCGHIYCRECFTKLEKCPMCTLPFDRKKIILLLNLPK